MAGIQADVDSWEMSIYRYLSTTHRRRSLMDAMYWEHPIDLDKIRRLVGWRQMTGGPRPPRVGAGRSGRRAGVPRGAGRPRRLRPRRGRALDGPALRRHARRAGLRP